MQSLPRWNAIRLIVSVGLAGEFILPWLLIGLSDLFLFDIPAWSLWAVLGGPPIATLVAIAAFLGLKRWASRTQSARIRRGRGYPAARSR